MTIKEHAFYGMILLLSLFAIASGIFLRSLNNEDRPNDTPPKLELSGQAFVQSSTSNDIEWGGKKDWWLFVMGGKKGIYDPQSTTIESKHQPYVSEKDGMWYITFDPTAK